MRGIRFTSQVKCSVQPARLRAYKNLRQKGLTCSGPPLYCRTCLEKKNMYAVVKTGGKQYRVSEGQTLIVEKLEGDAGAKVNLSEVLSLGGDTPQFGAPLVEGASVDAEIIEQRQGDKVLAFKKKRRHNYRRKLGHRQLETVLKITGINASGKKAAPAKKADDAAAEKKPAAKKPAAKKEAKKED
jgi:large subunit ribosomal protein L21